MQLYSLLNCLCLIRTLRLRCQYLSASLVLQQRSDKELKDCIPHTLATITLNSMLYTLRFKTTHAAQPTTLLTNSTTVMTRPQSRITHSTLTHPIFLDIKPHSFSPYTARQRWCFYFITRP